MKGLVTFLSLLLFLGCAGNDPTSGEFAVRELEEKENVLPKTRTEESPHSNPSTTGNQAEVEPAVTQHDPPNPVVNPSLPSKNRLQLDAKINQLRQDLEQEPASVSAGSSSGQHDRSGRENEQVTPRAPGGILRISASPQKPTLPFGETLNCRVAGELVVSQFDSFCLIDIYQEGRKVGFGFGQASFIVNDRVDVKVSKIAMNGKIFSGQFQAVTLDQSVGLKGKVNRQLGRIIFQGILSTLATGLAVKNPGDGLSSLLQANLANQSLNSLGSAIDSQRYYKTVTVPRQTPFQLISTGTNREVVNGQEPTDQFRNAFQDAMSNEVNQGALKAYMRNLNSQQKRQRP